MITNYTDLLNEVEAWSYRSDLTDRIPTFVQLCESDMQIRCKLVDFEGSATVTVTSGVGDLPADFAYARSVKWNSSPARELKYMTPAQIDGTQYMEGLPVYYTVIGDTIEVHPSQSGTIDLTYKARFVPLSTTPTNTILTRYPDAYLHGTLAQLAMYTKDQDTLAIATAAYERVIQSIKTDNNNRKYGSTLQVRAR